HRSVCPDRYRWAATVCAAFATGARSLIAGPSPAARKIEEAEQQQSADNRHMLQAGGQFVPELAPRRSQKRWPITVAAAVKPASNSAPSHANKPVATRHPPT